MVDLTRRNVLAAGAVAAATLGHPALAAAPSQSKERPNILWLVSEDNNPFIGAYGDRLAHTPTIDGLARKGLLYRNVYTNAPVCAPTRFAIITGVHPESAGPAHNMRAQAQLPDMIQGFPTYLREQGYYCTNNAKTDYNSDLKPDAIWNESSKQAHWKNRPDGAPFFAVFNHETTHESRIFEPLAGRVKPEDITLPTYLPDTPGIRRDFATYYNRMEQMDGQLAARLAELEAAGLAEDTIVFYYSDNGGVLPRSKRYCYDEGHRCAMVVHVPEKWRHLAPAAQGSEIGAPVTYIDLAPTVLSLAGIAAPAYMQGSAFLGRHASGPKPYVFGMRNRMDERYDMSRTVTDGRYRYIRNYSPHRPWGQHGAFQWVAKGYQDWEAAHIAGTLTPVQEQFWQTKPFEQFFDLHEDRDQVVNLIGDTAQQTRIAAMRRALDAHMLEVNDNGFLPEGSPVEGYLESRRKGAYPLKRIMAVAATAAEGNASSLTALVDLLGDGNAAVRYWAAQGLLIRGEAARSALPAMQAALSKDTDPHVRVALAEATARLTSDPAPIALLIDLLDHHPHPRVRLQAINALTYLGAKAAPARAAVQRAAESKDEYLVGAGRYLGFVLDGSYTPASPVLDIDAFMARMRAAPA
ncbi:sulfatase-like hydrolase/transferase [Novosphingobium sp. AP12]|uniref:sulfatase-like hydrolase/transferase n=1 Tax=Novosphingobium sp. AP12 TaxID=1144305 RepID=UPI000272238A|nr:sulfatase-like hydrolase/transferase [Novosphingobium sp. AP12]EJL35115.1 arylsulfatase A family protein [Novosphingobium sp. AP12]